MLKKNYGYVFLKLSFLLKIKSQNTRQSRYNENGKIDYNV